MVLHGFEASRETLLKHSITLSVEQFACPSISSREALAVCVVAPASGNDVLP